MSFFAVPLISRQSDIMPIGKQKSKEKLEVSKNFDNVMLDSNSTGRRPVTFANAGSEPSSRKFRIRPHLVFFKKLSHTCSLRRTSVPSKPQGSASRQSSPAQSEYKKSKTALRIGEVIPPNLSPKVSENSTPHQDIRKQRKKKYIFHRTQKNHSDPERIAIPEFVLFTDLSVFNTEEGIREAFLKPPLLLTRFENFMNDIQEHDARDLFNYAHPREKSLREYQKNRSVYMTSRWSETSSENFNDEKKINDCISHELFKCRDIIGALLNQQIESICGHQKVACEMLVQGNTINYVRYILTLPECSPSQEQNLNKFQKQAYEIKRALFGMGDALVTLDEFVPEKFPEKALMRDIILSKSISQHHINFNRLEYYAFQIWMKLASEFLIDKRITERFFRIYRYKMAMKNRESLKVLVFNKTFSANYSWYLAVTLPFMRIFEASLVNENVSFNSEDKDSLFTVKLPSQLSTTSSIDDADESLYQTYYSKLKLKDFEEFSRLSVKDLVNLQRSLSPKTETGNIIVKPVNFEYYARSLSTLSSDTFEVLQCRDFMTQVPPKNRVSVLKEFYRVIKVGGVLELPLLFSGSEAAVLMASLKEKGTDSFKVNDTKREEPYTLNSSKEILAYLGDLFGHKNIRYSRILLTPKNSVKNYLINHTAMFLKESFAELDQFEELAQTAKKSNKLGKDNVCSYVYISIEKLSETGSSYVKNFEKKNKYLF